MRQFLLGLGLSAVFAAGCVAGASNLAVPKAKAAYAEEQRWAYFCFDATTAEDVHSKANAAGAPGSPCLELWGRVLPLGGGRFFDAAATEPWHGFRHAPLKRPELVLIGGTATERRVRPARRSPEQQPQLVGVEPLDSREPARHAGERARQSEHDTGLGKPGDAGGHEQADGIGELQLHGARMRAVHVNVESFDPQHRRDPLRDRAQRVPTFGPELVPSPKAPAIENGRG